MAGLSVPHSTSNCVYSKMIFHNRSHISAARWYMYYVSTYFRSDSRIRTLEGPSRSSLAQWSDIFLKSNLNSYDFLDKFCIFFLCIYRKLNRKLKTNYLCTFKNKVFAIVVDEVHIWKYSTKIFAQNLPIGHVFILLGSLLKFHKLDPLVLNQVCTQLRDIKMG